jgi:hypothetical protein
MCVAIPWIVFWILVHNNELRFHPRDNARKKLITLSMVRCQESSAILYTLQLVFIVKCLGTQLEQSDI